MLDQKESDSKIKNRHLHEAMNLREIIVKLMEASEMIKILYNDGHSCFLEEDTRGYYDFLEKTSQMVNCLERDLRRIS